MSLCGRGVGCYGEYGGGRGCDCGCVRIGIYVIFVWVGSDFTVVWDVSLFF